MAIPIYLAMTAGEIQSAGRKPERIAWMACHFSPYSSGLINLPDEIPEGSLLILNDRMPIRGHDPDKILNILSERVNTLKASGILLDFDCRLPTLCQCAAGLNTLCTARHHTLYVPEYYANAAPNALVLISSAI